MSELLKETTSPIVVRLPDLPVNRPWQCSMSEHYKEIKAQSLAWVETFGTLEKPGLGRKFELCDCALLAAYTCCTLDKPLIRLGSDLTGLTLLFDEFTDVADASGAQKLCDIIMDAMKNPDVPRPDGEVSIGAIARDFSNCARAVSGPEAPCIEHFLQVWESYMTAIVQEVKDREKKTYRSFEDYLNLRRRTVGVHPSLTLLEYNLGIPEEVYNHPALASLRDKTAEIIAVSNDIYSFAVERDLGRLVHNGMGIIMHEKGVSVHEAIDQLEAYGKGVIERFLADVDALPSWGEHIDVIVRTYVNGLGRWIRAVDDWSFETQRYFGSKGPEGRSEMLFQRWSYSTILHPTFTAERRLGSTWHLICGPLCLVDVEDDSI